jgi:hypothetical protein
VVLAELGLSPYRGTVVRRGDTFTGGWTRELRREHLLWRLALTGNLLRAIDAPSLVAYRAAATDSTMTTDAPSSFVSVTLSRDVAEAHFSGDSQTVAAYLWRQQVPVDRVLMTFVETSAMSSQYLEAEAVLIAEENADWPIGVRPPLRQPSAGGHPS